MGVLADYMAERLADRLARQRVVVWYDPARDWLPLIEVILGRRALPPRAAAVPVRLAGREATLVPYAGSYYEVVQACEPLTSGPEPAPLLIYVPGETHVPGLSPLRELECLGGEAEPYQRELAQIARSAFQAAGLAEAKIDEVLARPLPFAHLDRIQIEGADDFSLLAPVFGSSREADVIPAFLVDEPRRREVEAKGLLGPVEALVERGLGLTLKWSGTEDLTAARLAQQLGRALLVAEMRSDLSGAEPVEITQVPKPAASEHVERIRAICAALRREQPDRYERLADEVERDIGLAGAALDPAALGSIDTFRFEERALLAACDRLLGNGEPRRALEIVEARRSSYWVSVARYPDRHAVWEACGELARLAVAVEAVDRALAGMPATPRAWVEAYCAEAGWQRMDRLFRSVRYRLAGLEDAAELERGTARVLGRYDAVLERMAAGFVGALERAGWQVEGVLPQVEVFERHIGRSQGRVGYILADALRFEMGAELAALLKAVGATAVRLEPAIAAAPTITDLGMAALLPGAERAFTLAATAKGVTGVVGGRPLLGSAGRMDHAKGAIPGLVEMSLDRLVHDLKPKRIQEELKDAPVVVIRSQEIDGAGESLPEGLTRRVMGTVLEDLRKAAQRLADAGVSRIVIAADHGHLFGERRGEDMKIDPPEGGQTVDLHRRCWVGRGGSTPPGCVRLAVADLGYEGSDLELVVPRGTAVFKAGGSLAFHHGGLSLQELVVPVLSFELKGRRTVPAAREEVVVLEGLQSPITNRIFSLSLRRNDLGLEPLQLQVLAVAAADRRTVGQATFAERWWDAERHVLTLPAGDQGKAAVSVGLMIDDDSVESLRVLVVEVGTDRTVKDTPPIPVRVIR